MLAVEPLLLDEDTSDEDMRGSRKRAEHWNWKKLRKCSWSYKGSYYNTRTSEVLNEDVANTSWTLEYGPLYESDYEDSGKEAKDTLGVSEEYDILGRQIKQRCPFCEQTHQLQYP